MPLLARAHLHGKAIHRADSKRGPRLLHHDVTIPGLALFYAGVETPLVGGYGDLLPSRSYARVQAGLYHPNLLARYCIFAAAVVSMPLSTPWATLLRTITAWAWPGRLMSSV